MSSNNHKIIERKENIQGTYLFTWKKNNNEINKGIVCDFWKPRKKNKGVDTSDPADKQTK